MFELFGGLALVIGLLKLTAIVGVVRRRSRALVLGVVVSSVDGLFVAPLLSGPAAMLVALEILADAFVVWALVQQLKATPQKSIPGSTWEEFKADSAR